MDEKLRHRRLRFGLRTLFEIIAVVAFILTLIYYRAAALNEIGRYQFDVEYRSDRKSPQKWVIDTQTGQMWRYSYVSEEWQDDGFPPVLNK